MQLGMIGLGKMGGNMTQRLLDGGHEVVGYDRDPAILETLGAKGMIPANSLEDMVSKLSPQRAIWIMVPAGKPVTQTIDALLPLLSPEDILIDGGNSYYKDSVVREADVRKAGFRMLDVGTSGGIWGLKEGYCMMIGGDRLAFEYLEPIFKTLAPADGYEYMGQPGSGHFVKMVHNGIEYGMLQAYGEGFEILNASNLELDLTKITKLWNKGSVIRSWLLELAENAFERDPLLSDIRGYVEDSGEGRWTVFEAINQDVPAPILTLSLLARFSSRQSESFSAKVIAALRNEFGGHAVQKKELK